MAKVKLFGLKSNWEAVAFYLIDPLVNERRRTFSRTEFLKHNLEMDVMKLLGFMGHKKNQKEIINTLQGTLQKMRNKGWIKFLTHYGGEYELTDEGYKILLEIKPQLNMIKEMEPELKNM